MDGNAALELLHCIPRFPPTDRFLIWVAVAPVGYRRGLPNRPTKQTPASRGKAEDSGIKRMDSHLIMTTKRTLGKRSAPRQPKALLKKEHGIWVLLSEPTDVSIVDLIDRNREAHIRKQACLP